MVLISLLFFASINNCLVPIEKIREIGTKFVQERYGVCQYHNMIPYYDLNDEVVAYALIFETIKKEPATIIMGARMDCSPIFEVSKSFPRFYTEMEKIKRIASNALTGLPKFKKVYYYGPGNQYFLFSDGKEEVLINAYTYKVHNCNSLKLNGRRDKDIESILKQKWQNYLSSFDYSARDTAYVDSVPFIDYIYGTTPASAAIILWYWDPREYGRLVDFYFNRAGTLERGWFSAFPNVVRELALAMNTDTMSGGTFISNIAPGIEYVTDSLNDYDFQVSTSPQGNQSNGFYFSWIKNEIDNFRPGVWNVLNYQGDPNFNTTACAVGYIITATDTFIIVHWPGVDYEMAWPLWTYANGYQSYDYVTKVIPGGGIPDNLFITFPTDSGIILLYNMKYNITWKTVGTSINHLSIWYASEYDSSTWTLLSSNVPNTGFYTWTVPPESLYGRINLAGWDNINSLVATDGSFYRFITKPVIKSPNVHLFSHIPPGAYDGVNSGNCFYLYRDSSLSIYDITDITAPLLIKKIKAAGRDGRLFRNGSYLYLSTGYDHSLQIFDITDPQNPVFCGSLNFSSQARGLYVSDTLCYLANSTQGLRIISVANPSSPYELGSYNTPGISYDVVIVDTLAIVADGNNGIVTLNIKTPSSPALISTYNTPGNAFGVDYNGYLYVSDGSSGLGIIDITDPANPVSVGWYDTPGLAYRSRCFGENLFVADGNAGVRILNCADLGNIYEIGYLDSYGSAQSILINDTLVFLADNGDGGYIIDARVMGIEETRRGGDGETGRILEVYPNPFTDKVTIKFEIRSTKSETNSKSQIPNKNLATRYSLLPTLRIYDATGRLVKQFNHLTIQPFNQIIWSGDDNFGRELPPGIYFVSLKKKNHTVTKKAVYLK